MFAFSTTPTNVSASIDSKGDESNGEQELTNKRRSDIQRVMERAGLYIAIAINQTQMSRNYYYFMNLSLPISRIVFEMLLRRDGYNRSNWLSPTELREAALNSALSKSNELQIQTYGYMEKKQKVAEFREATFGQTDLDGIANDSYRICPILVEHEEEYSVNKVTGKLVYTPSTNLLTEEEAKKAFDDYLVNLNLTLLNVKKSKAFKWMADAFDLAVHMRTLNTKSSSEWYENLGLSRALGVVSKHDLAALLNLDFLDGYHRSIIQEVLLDEFTDEQRSDFLLFATGARSFSLHQEEITFNLIENNNGHLITSSTCFSEVRSVVDNRALHDYNV